MSLRVDSRKVKPGDTFIAIRGITEDGHKYIDTAIKNGVTKIICEEGNYSVETIIVPNSKKYLEEEILKLYKEVLKDIKLVGVTGTNGKTTVSFFVYELLNKLGLKTAVLGTIGFYVDDIIIPTTNTTPGMLELYELFKEAKERNCKCIIMEISSHALIQERIKGLTFDIEGFTNLTEDHLDYHHTMEGYRDAKVKILNYLSDDGTIIINNDDKYADSFKKKNYLSYGLTGEHLKINNYNLFENYFNVSFTYEEKNYMAKVNVPSDFNIYNYLMAFLIVNKLGYKIDEILKLSNILYLPKGRCESISVGNGTAIIDFAHTPDALNKIIDNYRKLCKGKIITITGCDGDRDKFKREPMVNIACKKSDYVIFTHVDPFNEDMNEIKNEILKYSDKNNSEFVDERKEAIKKGLDMIENGDYLLILGMGAETYQTIKGQKIPHSDFEEVLKYKKENNK